MVKSIVIDCHADTLLKKYLEEMMPLLFAERGMKFHASKDLLTQGGVDIQVFAIFVPPKLEKIGIEVSLEMITLAKEMEKDGFILIKSKKDLKTIENSKNGIGMVLSLEGTVALERNLQLLPIFYELGIRNIGLSWSRKNLFCEGTGLTQDSDEGEGISVHGKELLEQMESLGIIIDVSHLNKKGFADVVKVTSDPFIASHSNAYQLCPVNRNLTDEQLMEIASAEGVVGINFYPRFLSQNDPQSVSIKDVIQHIKYITNLLGVDHVGLGSDFDGIGITPKGLETASKIKNIPPLLEEEGFSNQDIEKIMGTNFKRVFNRVWK
ncbi:MAG: dipeptidase [Candidatus Heimdallarchaeota archaeon]|nr:MAG: dipeptidase [Candidatus Heimdallarchaeota archaeon]